MYFFRYLYFSCKDGGIEIKGFNLWLLSITERNLEPSFNLKNKVKLSDSLFLSQQNDEKVVRFKYRDRDIQLFGNNEIGVGILKKSNGIHFVSLYDIRRGIEL